VQGSNRLTEERWTTQDSLGGPWQQQQQDCFEKPVVLTANLVAAKAMTANLVASEAMTANNMIASAVRGWCRQGRRLVTLRSALMISEAVAPALSS